MPDPITPPVQIPPTPPVVPPTPPVTPEPPVVPVVPPVAPVVPPVPPVPPVVPVVPPITPVAYDLKLASDSPLDAADLDRITAYARSQNLSPEAAAALLKESETTAAGLVTRQLTNYETTKAQWVEAVKTDPELGGAAFDQTMANTKRVMDKFAHEGFKTFLIDSGYGNHPEVVRFINRIGKAMAEDAPPPPPGPGPGDRKSLAQVFYPNMAQ